MDSNYGSLGGEDQFLNFITFEKDKRETCRMYYRVSERHSYLPFFMNRVICHTRQDIFSFLHKYSIVFEKLLVTFSRWEIYVVKFSYNHFYQRKTSAKEVDHWVARIRFTLAYEV